MSYRAPVSRIRFALEEIGGLRRNVERGVFGDLTTDLVAAILEEAGRFASEEIAPLNRTGDIAGARLEDGEVRMPPGWHDVYRRWCAGGWPALTGPESHGGQNLPMTVSAAVQEMWNAASMAFGIGPVLTIAAADALHRYGTSELKECYLARLLSGEWTGTMCLTEPQAGSDLGLLRCRAELQEDGSYRLRGTKIYITYGEHDLTGNIVHMVLARLPDAPPGHRGISMFLVPKYLVREDGALGCRNDVRCVGVERKLGIHGSPTCTMSFGEDKGAVGWLMGKENQGLACMFTMMNQARLMVGVQGVAIAERAYQQAYHFADERHQGRRPGMGPEETVPIRNHPDIRRGLMAMRALTDGARALCQQTAQAIDIAARSPDADERTAAQARADLLTPVAKAFSTDTGVEVASVGVQIHGGMGYMEETGAAQHLRDARIAPIYEGTNGIQAIDLVTRKLGRQDGQAAALLVADLRATADALLGAPEPGLHRIGGRLAETIDALEQATNWMQETLSVGPDAALAGATPYLRLFGLAVGGSALGGGALAAARAEKHPEASAHIATAGFFAENLCPEATALRDVVIRGAETALADPPAPE